MTRLAYASVVACLFACGGNLGDPAGDGPDGGDRNDGDGPTGLIDYDPSNIPVDHLTVGTASLSFSQDIIINSDTGEITGPGAALGLPVDSIFVLVNQQDPLAPTLGVFSWAELTIEDGVTVTVEGQNGLVFALNGNALINGVIQAGGGVANAAGPGGFVGGDNATPTGSGPGGGGTRNGYDAGGGGGGLGGLGGEGGRQEGRAGGEAGMLVGTEQNVPLFGGSGGGRGGNGNSAGVGGGGGGAIQFSARGEVRFGPGSGINVSGSGGVGGDNDEAGGGGGAGGAILLEGKLVVVDGTLAANGGGGGAGANEGNKGNDGLPGAFDDTVAAGGAGAGEGTSGGAGAAAADIMGQPGQAGIANTGGGGGGAGRIFVRSRQTAAMAGLVSPTASLTIGML